MSAAAAAAAGNAGAASGSGLALALVPPSGAIQPALPGGIIVHIQNVVATANLDTKLDLKLIAQQARNAEYNPKRFAACIIRVREPKTTALIFASGKMVVTGAKTEDMSRSAARTYAKIIQKLDNPVKFKDFTIQNMVGSCDVQFPIRLEGLAFTHSKFANYEPELFPGLIYRMAQPKVVLLIFVSGKVVITGAKKREDIHKAIEQIYNVLVAFKKVAGAPPPAAAPRLAAGAAAGAAPLALPPPSTA